MQTFVIAIQERNLHVRCLTCGL